MRWRSWRDSSVMARSLTMVLSSTWPGVACSPWQPIRRFGVPFKEGGNGGVTGGDEDARGYSFQTCLTRHGGTWGQALDLDGGAHGLRQTWLAELFAILLYKSN